MEDIPISNTSVEDQDPLDRQQEGDTLPLTHEAVDLMKDGKFIQSIHSKRLEVKSILNPLEHPSTMAKDKIEIDKEAGK